MTAPRGKTLVLIHGGLHGTWCWDRVLPPLRAAGHDVVVVELPGRAGAVEGLTFDDYVDAIDARVSPASEPVVVVAHSLGAVAASQFAERRPEAISRMVLVNGLLTENGEAPLPKLQTAGEGCGLMLPGALTFSDDGTVTADYDAAVNAFYNRCEPSEAAWAAKHLCAEPIAPLMTPMSITAAGFGSVQKTYVGSRDDLILPWTLQQSMADSSGSELIWLDGDHSPWLSVPEAFLRCILTCAEIP